jgi:hypothetical protein
MKRSFQFPFAITFDCDPAAFDQTLELTNDSNFMHLWQSVPLALAALRQAEEITNLPISATFFIRNLSAISRNSIISENWKEFMPLWEEVLKGGHTLGLHPHINFPLVPELSGQSQEIQGMMKNDFKHLSDLGVTTRITRIGGHAYNSQTSDILSLLDVSIDSSAIPGRKLGEYTGTSDWRKYTNRTLRNWSYNMESNLESYSKSSLTQIPMSTLQQISNSNFFRYIDFSYKTFSDHSFLTSRFLTDCDVGVSVTHPSALLSNQYLKHHSLEFGIENWLLNFKNFFDICNSEDVDFRFTNLGEL